MRFGVDEAGKGPVLGSMFAAAVLANPADLPDGVADSKRLSPDRRESIAAELRAEPDIHVGVAEIPVSRIDDPDTDMNTLTVTAQASALTSVARDGVSGVVDAGDTNPERFARRVAERVSADLSIRAEHGADERYPLVSAASIVAKVSRDEHVAELQRQYETPIGSGYPGDQTTRSFLEGYVRETGRLPSCARRSWQTSRDVRSAVEQADFADF